MRKNFGKRLVTLATVSALTMGCIPMNVFAAEKEVHTSENPVDNGAFRAETDNSTEYQTWKAEVWDAGEKADSGKMALTPGNTEKDLNFAWYSVEKGIEPAVMVWESGKESEAKVFRGKATTINASNVQGSTYEAYNHVSIEGFFKANAKYVYKYTDSYTGSTSVWSEEFVYRTADTDNFSVIVTGDPQIGASGNNGKGTVDDLDIARDTYNWNKTMTTAADMYPDAALLLSVGDQIDWHTGATLLDMQVRESEYAGYLYPSVFRSLPIAATIGNHDTMVADYSQHFNNPNSEDYLGATEAGSDFYYSYGEVLFICLNSNSRNQAEHRALMEDAVASNPDAKWRIAYFHADIYGSGVGHADTDSSALRIVLAPLMDEFDIDMCLTGHDHTYTRSYQLLDGSVIEYDLTDSTVTNPEGTVYVTTGGGSGSKYYNFTNYTQYYIADRSNAALPTFSVLEFEGDSMTLKTFDYNGEKYADDYTIIKNDEEASVEDVIAVGEEKLSQIKVEYTAETLETLKTAVNELKKIQADYTTAEDALEKELVDNYNTAEDRCVATGVVRADGKVDGLGYGHVYSSEDKDNGANRFKAGLSTLLDKTYYIQNASDEVNENLPIVSAAVLEEAKIKVMTAIEALVEVEEESTEEETSLKAETTTDESTSGESESEVIKPADTGDEFTPVPYIAVMLIAAGVGMLVFRKKEDNECETR